MSVYSAAINTKFIGRKSTEMNKRLMVINQICSVNENLKLIQTGSFLFYKNAHMAYCPNAKAGTSSLLSILFKLANVNKNTLVGKSLHKHAWKLFSPPSGSIQNNFIKFTVVRHPFTRLISAYADKIARNYRSNLQKKMMKLYRNSPKQKLEEWKKISTELGANTDKSPTVWEFLSYVVDLIKLCEVKRSLFCFKIIDVHWKPFYTRCNPCVVHYDVIAKLETFGEDLRYIKYKLSNRILKEEKVLFEKLSLNKTNESELEITLKENERIIKTLHNVTNVRLHAHEGPSKSGVTKKVFSLLTEEEKLGLIEAFKYDFIMFDYNPYKFD